jgi:hypothetical protein
MGTRGAGTVLTPCPASPHPMPGKPAPPPPRSRTVSFVGRERRVWRPLTPPPGACDRPILARRGAAHSVAAASRRGRLAGYRGRRARTQTVRERGERTRGWGSLPAEGGCVVTGGVGRDEGCGGKAVMGRGGGGGAPGSHARGFIPGLTPRSPSGAGLALPDRFHWGRGRRWWWPVNHVAAPAISDREPKRDLSGREPPTRAQRAPARCAGEGNLPSIARPTARVVGILLTICRPLPPKWPTPTRRRDVDSGM